MFNKKYDSVYVVCPASSKTGGLELLHQLTFMLNQLGLNAKIAYTNIKDDHPTNPDYERYVSDYVEFIELLDRKKILVVISEHQIELMDKLKNAEVAIWWLSVDNYQKVYEPKKAYSLLGWRGVAWYIKNGRWKYRVSKINKKIKYNFAQSHYAIDFLQKNGFSNIEYLSDYINSDYLQIALDKSKERNNVVLYNPKKGKKYSDYLMGLDRSIIWVPLINLTNHQVRDLLLTSKVYIDFGNHPGKDRFPREAAMCGCCVITGERGAAKFYKDVPIPEKYKLQDKKQNGMKIINCIKDCFDKYEYNFDDFDYYRKMIASEQECFIADVEKIFLR
ncbi:hypothetical protein Q5O24_08615 [Eubacteriaceae bacterium ES3]|nr:hypothetical protein Q5O24_08615 [Eubacteriaceae bacterium ES3]